jgi:hypothetical protein
MMSLVRTAIKRSRWLAWGGIGSSVVLAALLGYAGKFDLSGPAANGFAICYLIVPAYIPLLIADGIAGLFGGGIDVACGREILLFALCDIFIAVNVWWIVKFAAYRKQSVSLLRSAKKLVWIVVCWGIFQLCCTLITFAWQKSSFKSGHFHRQSQVSPDQP